VRLEIRKDLIKQAAAKKGTDQIVVSVRAAGSDGERYAVPEQIKFEAEAAEDLSKCGKALKMKLIDTDGDAVASAGGRVFTKTPGKGLYIAFKYNIAEMEVVEEDGTL